MVRGRMTESVCKMEWELVPKTLVSHLIVSLFTNNVVNETIWCSLKSNSLIVMKQLQHIAAKTWHKDLFCKNLIYGLNPQDWDSIQDCPEDRKFKYLAEIITPGDIEKGALGERARKMETSFKICYGIYKSKSLF